MEYRIDCNYDVKHIELDFNEVEVGVSKIKSIKIINQCSTKQSYVVERDPTSNPLDNVFDTVEYAWTLRPCESYVCDISFKPALPNRKYIDYFFITDTYKCCYKIVVQGFSVGPKVTSPKTRLMLICKEKPCAEECKCKSEKCIKLTNHTNVPAKFMFDIDTVQCPFKINEPRGVIKASSTKCFNVSFEPPAAGIYKYHMHCLILNQEPIILELFGFCGCDCKTEQVDATRKKIEMVDELDVTDTFRSYMNDVTRLVKHSPPTVSLSASFIDFGQAEIGQKSTGKRPPLTVSLTNHNKFSLLVSWETDVADIFSIRPREAKVRSDKSIDFEVRFDPTKPRTFYSRQLTARVFRLPCCTSNDNVNIDELAVEVVPEFLTIRLIGHTYEHGCNDWMPQYAIPEMVVLPACLPASPVYTTFALRNFGQQPLMFNFFPPDTSFINHYSVKPRVGVICPEQEQLICVQLFPGADENRAYVERWAVRLNGNPKNETCVDLQGYVELAGLIVGDDNFVGFNPVHVGCRQERTVQTRNPTRHSVRFEYLLSDFPKELSIQPMCGVLHPNETICQNWTFMPDQLRNYDFDISCNLSAEIGGRSILSHVEVAGNSTEGTLIAIPEELKFGDQAYNKSCMKEFKAFNFSPVTIHFLIVCRPMRNLEIMKNPECDVKISPVCGSINPGRGEKIEVTLTPTQTGFYELTIEYYLRADATSDSSIPLFKPISLCTLTCMCYMPTIQIKDLLYRAETNKGISKVFLWKSLAIDDLNAALKDLEPHYEATIEMTVPLDSTEENEALTIKLLVKNLNPIKASWVIKKKKSCLCNDRTAKYRVPMKWNPKTGCVYCLHDQACTIRPKDITLETDDSAIITIEIKNKTLKSEGIFWHLDIEEDRLIILNIKLQSSIIWSGPLLKFKKVYIGQCTCSKYQAIWLYNNTENECIYEIEMNPFISINKKNCGIIFTCLNPSGTINGYARKPIFFGFRPNRIGKFEVDILVKVGDKESILEVEAESLCTFITNVIDYETCPYSDTFMSQEFIAYFNHDYAVVPPILVHGKATKIVMIHNHHLQNVLQFEWKSVGVPGIIKIDIEPSSGLIQPQSLLTFLIKITAGYNECSLQVDLLCKFIDVSERRFAEKKRGEQEHITKQLECEFTITEKGISYPDKPVFPPIKEPPTFYKTLTLKVDIYNYKDADQNINLRQQLKNTPLDEVIQDILPYENNVASNLFDMSTQIFECILWDIINSSHFGLVLKENLTTKHNLTYSQLPIKIVKRKKEVKRSKWVPPRRYVEDILHTMVCMIVHEEFNFDTAHFTHPPDVRQISYQKVYSENIPMFKKNPLG